MAATNFKTENNTFRKLVGNGLTYCIPRFQRDYSWQEEEWEDLWADLQGTLQPNGEPAHYMGYLVLKSADDKNFEVIDGQQRLTTISIIVLAVLKNLQRLIKPENDDDSNQRRMDQLRQNYIGYLNPVTLVAQSKLVLNRNNDHYYQNYIVPLGYLPQRGFRTSEHLLRKAFEWFDKHVTDFLGKDSGNEGQRLARFVEEMSDRLFFTVITVTDELNAYKVFETLNARGVRLSTTDLLKNYFFSLLDRKNSNGNTDDHEISNLEERWEKIVERLGIEIFPDFLRVNWNSRRSFTRQTELFKVIRRYVQSREMVFQLLREMEEDLDTYLALSSPEASDWSQETKISVITLKTFNVRQPYPLLLSAKRHFTSADFDGLIRTCVTISMRFNVICGYGTADQESTYNTVARKIATKDIRTLRDALDKMRDIYPKDDAFREAFAEKSIRTDLPRNNRVVRYILCALEKHLSGRDCDFASSSFSIEHVLPQNPDTGWEAFSDTEATALVNRLGNVTIVKNAINNELGNAPYTVKRSMFAESDFAITKKLAQDHAEWTPAQIAAHQKWMAKQATAIWRIAQLD